jgi:hypothetical protein
MATCETLTVSTALDAEALGRAIPLMVAVEQKKLDDEDEWSLGYVELLASLATAVHESFSGVRVWEYNSQVIKQPGAHESRPHIDEAYDMFLEINGYFFGLIGQVTPGQISQSLIDFA